MEGTGDQVALRLAATAHAGRVAGDVVLGMALRSGFGALAAERVRAAVNRAVAGSGDGARLVARAEAGRLLVELSGDGDGDGWSERVAQHLAAHDPVVSDGHVRVIFHGQHRGGLRAV